MEPLDEHYVDSWRDIAIDARYVLRRIFAKFAACARWFGAVFRHYS